MRCPNCGSENNDSAKFCKKCGTPLKENTINHESMINSMSNSNKSDTTKYIIIALIVVAVVLAGAFVYIYGFGSNNDDSNAGAVNNTTSNAVQQTEPAQATQSTQDSQSKTTSSMFIKGGTFSTGSSLSDKTYASIYVGSEHAGEKVKIQIYYSRDGSALNHGNMVPKTVDSSGYINVRSADSYDYYPDYASINLYDANGNLLDVQSVSLNPDSGSQSFTV